MSDIVYRDWYGNQMKVKEAYGELIKWFEKKFTYDQELYEFRKITSVGWDTL